MRTYVGDGYTLTVVQPDGVMENPFTIGPGAVLVSHGAWVLQDNFGNVTVLHSHHTSFTERRQAAEILGPVRVLWGEGGIGVAQTTRAVHTSPSTVRVQVRGLERHEKAWGWEEEVPTARKDLQLKLISVEHGHRTSEQFHRKKHEIMAFIDGKDPDVLIVPDHHVHRIAGSALYFEASTFEPDDLVRLADDYGRDCAPAGAYKDLPRVG